MSVFYYQIVETGDVSLNMALSIPMLFVGIGLYVDALLRPDHE